MKAMARVPMQTFSRLTGLRLGLHVALFALEDAQAAARYAARAGARRAERSAVARASTAADWFAVSRAHFGGGPVQIPTEIFALLELAAASGTRVVCEIGAYDAGTSLLFSRGIPGVDTLAVMDLYVKNRWRLRRAAPPGQTIHAIDGDSSHPLTVDRLRRKLGGRRLDLLLIDGDHEFAGVQKDFLAYRGFVRDGGLIAFHDIMPVRGPESGRSVGGVPDFWELIKPFYPSREFVADRRQEGLGIGVLTYQDSVSVEPIAAAARPASGGQAPP